MIATELKGRRKIYTDEKTINEDNVIQVLQDSLIIHMQNVAEIKYLLDYEKGNQPLTREKTVRKDIDIKVCDNVANEVTEFKLGYVWGNPITMVQRGDNDISGSNASIDDNAIAMFNEMLDFECAGAKDQEMARYIEITGIGYRMIDIKSDYSPEMHISAFDYITLNPLFTFIVYTNDALRQPIMGCTYRREQKSGNCYYTCFTKEMRYEIKNEVTIVNGNESKNKFSFNSRNGEKNPLGMIPIIEYIRSYDRMGCFERQISDMNNLNILVSDFTNDVAQNTQAIWWGNDIEIPKDKDGNDEIRSGMWIITKTGNATSAKPDIKPLMGEFNYEGVLSNIKYRREVILQKCNVPLRSEPGGGSTGSAMSMSSGWSAAEVSACKEEQMIRQGKMQEIKLILAAIKKAPKFPQDSPLLELKMSDIKPRIIRNKTYDMATKANTFATYIKNGIHGRHALEVIDAFADPQQTWVDSKDVIDTYQQSIISNPGKAEVSDRDSDRVMSDMSDQNDNSPIVVSGN